MNENSKATKGGLRNAMDSMCGLVEQTYHYEKTLFDLTNKVAKNKAQIKREMQRKDVLKISNAEGHEFRVENKPDVSLNFDMDKMRKTLDKETFERVTNKKVFINDINALIAMLKQYGVPPKKFKTFIEVEHAVDEEKLDHLIDIEDISVAEAQEFTSLEIEDVINIKKVK